MATAESRHVHPRSAFVWLHDHAITVGVSALVSLVLLIGAAPAHAAEPRVSQHGLGFGYHTVIFHTESTDSYTLHGPSLVYDYFFGRRWGFMLRGAAYFPVFGHMSGPSGDFSGSLVDMYDQRQIGFDTLLMAARRTSLGPKLLLTYAVGAHLQGFALAGTQYSPVEAVSLGLGGLGKLDFVLNEWLSASVQLAVGSDFFDLVDHQNPAQLVVPLSGSFAFAARY